MSLSTEEVNTILDKVKVGDYLIVTRKNKRGTKECDFSTISGPVLVHRKSIGIDLFDGHPHEIRDDNGTVYGNITNITLCPPDGNDIGVYESDTHEAIKV